MLRILFLSTETPLFKNLSASWKTHLRLNLSVKKFLHNHFDFWEEQKKSFTVYSFVPMSLDSFGPFKFLIFFSLKPSGRFFGGGWCVWWGGWSVIMCKCRCIFFKHIRQKGMIFFSQFLLLETRDVYAIPQPWAVSAGNLWPHWHST